MEKTSTGVTPTDLLYSGEKVKRRTLFRIPVKDGVTYCNMIAIPLVPLTMMILSTYLNAEVIFILADPAFFGIAPDKIGYVSGVLIFASLPGAIIGTFFVGFVFDILGRKITLFVSFFIGSILLAVIPWTAPKLYEGLLVVRVLIQLCFCAPVSNPLPADYIHREAIGMGTSMQGIGLVIGEVISMGVLFRLTVDMDPVYGFAIAGGLGLFFSFCFLFIVKEPQLRSSLKPSLSKALATNNPLPIGIPYESNVTNTSIDEGSATEIQTDQI
jgi:MFS family permease